MNVHICYKLPRTPDIDREIQHWINKVQRRLEVFRPELVHLKGLVEQNSPREGTRVSLNLRLPSGQMAAQESAHSPTAAIKAAFEDLLAQIGKHKELLRNSHSWHRRRSLPGARVREVPFEETLGALAPETATSEDIRAYVNANLDRLRLYVEREISFRENSGDLKPDWLNWEEVVDEAVARALDDKIEKPDPIALEPWLYRLAIRSLDDFEARLARTNQVDLNGPHRRTNQHARDEARLQFYQPDEAITRESTIADLRLSTPEQIAYSEEMISLVQFALRQSGRRDREAFILFAMEGFSLEEISAIVDRPPEEVRQSVEKAREKLRRSLPVDPRVKNKLLEAAGTA
jgi:RNA polymerase sigma factor (sigma-70 family)